MLQHVLPKFRAAGHKVPTRNPTPRERGFFIDNRLVRIHFIIVMIGWTGLPEFRAACHKVQRFRGGLVFNAHRLCVSLNARLESKEEEEEEEATRCQPDIPHPRP